MEPQRYPIAFKWSPKGTKTSQGTLSSFHRCKRSWCPLSVFCWLLKSRKCVSGLIKQILGPFLVKGGERQAAVNGVAAKHQIPIKSSDPPCAIKSNPKNSPVSCFDRLVFSSGALLPKGSKTGFSCLSLLEPEYPTLGCEKLYT